MSHRLRNPYQPLTDHLPTVGRGSATWKVFVRRQGPPIHEVMRPVQEPNVIAAGADLVGRLMRLAEQLGVTRTTSR